MEGRTLKCCDITSGKLRQNISIERKTSTPDGAGGQSITWAEFANIRAYIKPMSGGERLRAMRLEATVTHRIFIRYRSDIKTNDRINYSGRYMQIRALINLEERNRWIEIHADEGDLT